MRDPRSFVVEWQGDVELNFCPQGCGGMTEDDAGGPCGACWSAVGRREDRGDEPSAEPMCCDEPMVHNTFMGQWECAAAYFELVDDDVIADTGFGPYALRVERVDQLGAHHRERYEHWIASVRLDEPAGDTPQAVDHG